jgi:hypothetical protein
MKKISLWCLVVALGAGAVIACSALIRNRNESRPVLVSKLEKPVDDDEVTEAWKRFYYRYQTQVSVIIGAIDKMVPSDRNWLTTTNCPGTREQCVEYLALSFFSASLGKDGEKDIPPLLLVAMAQLESELVAFRYGRPIRGKLGELGMIQLKGGATRGCEFSTVGGQIECGARYFRKLLVANDGNLVKSLTEYASGKRFSTRPRTINWVVPKRFFLWWALEFDLPTEKIRWIIQRRHVDGFKLSDWGEFQALYDPTLEV